MASVVRGLVGLLIALSSLTLSAAPSTSAPVCPCAGAPPYPPFGAIDGPSTVESWHAPATLPRGCVVRIRTNEALVIAVAGRFTHAGTIDDIAARLGAVSATRGLSYWSVTRILSSRRRSPRA